MWVSPNKFRVGNIDVLAVSDGKLALKPEGLFKDVPREEWQAEVKLDENGNVVVGMNSLVFRSGGKLILLDTGLGDKPATMFATGSANGSPELSRLIARLAEQGIRREDIDIVINTHAHPDHIGWNTLVEDGKLVPTFPNAKYWMTKTEWDFYTVPRRMERYAFLMDNLQPILERGQFELADGETDVTSEVRIIPSPGHTVGHACIMIHSAQEVALFLGDLMHHPAHLEHPEWVNAVDVLPQQTPVSRRNIIREAYRHDAVLVACHSSYSGFSRIVNDSGADRLVPLEPPAA